MSDIKPYLGDVLGGTDPIVYSPIRKVRYGDEKDPINFLKTTFLAGVACIVFGAMVLLAIAVMFLTTTKSIAQEQKPQFSPTQIKLDCTPDAFKYCKPTFKDGYDAILACMIANKSRLRPICQRHMW